MTECLQELIISLLHKMERPEPWGIFHTLFFVIGIPLAILTALLLHGLSKKGERRLFLWVGSFLLISELFKQLAYTAIEGSYRFDLIPFQLCSIPMYLCLALAVIPEGRLTRFSVAARTFIATFGLMGGLASYISPATMCRDWLELTLHSFIWHLLLIFLGAYVFFSGNSSFERKDFPSALLLYFSLCLIALAINLVCINTPGADVNMFYIGPKPSILPICRDITARFGVFFNSAVYVFSLSLCAYLIFLLESLIKKNIKI